MSGESLLAVAVGLGLAASAGMRVFLPLFVLGVAGFTGTIPLAEGWTWLSSPVALIGLGTAMVLEIGAYYVPWVDQALDVVATPAALIAGMIATASVLVDMPPLLKWAIVIVGGGGVAGLTQGASVLTRVKSGVLTGGLANPVVSTAEWLGALALALVAVLLPIVAVVLVGLVLLFLLRRADRVVFRRRSASASPSSPRSPGRPA